MPERKKIDDTVLMQIAAGEVRKRRAAQREHPLFEEIHQMIVDIANRHSEPESVREALPRLGGLLKRLQDARAKSENDLEDVYAQQASARDELRSRLARNELSENAVALMFLK